MYKPSRRQLIIWSLTLVVGVSVFLWLWLSPIGKPADVKTVLYLVPKYGSAKMERIVSKPNGRGLMHLPRQVQVTSNGPAMDAYLIDMSGISGKERISRLRKMRARVIAGSEPRAAFIKAKQKNVTEATFPMFVFPWGSNDDTWLIVYSKVKADAEVRISYGR